MSVKPVVIDNLKTSGLVAVSDSFFSETNRVNGLNSGDLKRKYFPHFVHDHLAAMPLSTKVARGIAAFL